MVSAAMAGCLMGSHMPRTPEEFNNYVAKELRAGDKRMDEIVKTVAAIQVEQASAKLLLAENTETIKEIKTDTPGDAGLLRLLRPAGRGLLGAAPVISAQ